jgi:type I restriction enzyme, S subunit
VSNLPENWANSTLGEIASQGQYGWTTKAANQGSVKYLRTTDLTSGYVNWDTVPYCQEPPPSIDKYKIKPGDILISRAGSVGYSILIDEFPPTPSVFASYLIRYILDSDVNAKFVSQFLQSQDYWQQISDASAGIALANVNAKKLSNVVLPIPPLAEQKRIADKLDSLLAKVDTCQAHLDRIPQILKRFRQAVLAAATSGRLTEEWRKKENHDGRTASFDFYDADCFGDYEFPATWKVLRLSDFAAVIGGITKDSKKQSLADEELPYLRVANVQRGYLDLAEMKTIRVPKSRVEDWLLKPGDILFNEGGDIDKLGRGWIWKGEIDRCIFQNHVFRARLAETDFVPEYFSHYGNSRGYDYFLRYGKQTTNLASINKTIIERLPVAVPPPDEQHEIVRRVEKLFAYADRLEARYQAAQARITQLTPSLLAKAFRGELVPQDPRDEPAEALLARNRSGAGGRNTP